MCCWRPTRLEVTLRLFFFLYARGEKKRKTSPNWIHRGSTQPLKSKTNDRSSRIYNENCCDTALVVNDRISALHFWTSLAVFTDKPDHRQIYCKNVRSSKLARHLKTHRALRPSPCQRKRNTKRKIARQKSARVVTKKETHRRREKENRQKRKKERGTGTHRLLRNSLQIK